MKGYKTILFSVLTFLIALAGFFGFGDWVMPEEISKWYGLALPLVFALLRYFTDTEVFKKE